jgi:hypothetical protein
MGQMGPEPVGDTKADAQGKFSISAGAEGQGPQLVRVTHDGVTYNQIIPPGTPSSNINVSVYNVSSQPGAAKVAKHMILFQPQADGQVQVSETFLFSNGGKTTWNDAKDGTLRFYLPPGAQGKVDVSATPPGGMPLPQSAEKAEVKDTYKVPFAIKPGETRIDLTYSVPYKEGEDYEGKIVTKDDNTYLIVPNGVTLKGEGLNDLGVEPRTQAHLFGFTKASYKVQMAGVPVDVAGGPSASDADQNSGPGIEVIPPRVFGRSKLIVALGLSILGLGFVLLYRAQQPKELNERRRG